MGLIAHMLRNLPNGKATREAGASSSRGQGNFPSLMLKYSQVKTVLHSG
jgi:hypothetical protein